MSEPIRYPDNQPQGDELNEVDRLAPADVFDPVIEAYKKDVDRTILRENLKLSPQERSEKFVAFMKSVWELRRTAQAELALERGSSLRHSSPLPDEKTSDPAPADGLALFIEAIKEGVDRSQLRSNLKLTEEQRVQKYLGFVRLASELREAGRRARERDPSWGL